MTRPRKSSKAMDPATAEALLRHIELALLIEPKKGREQSCDSETEDPANPSPESTSDGAVHEQASYSHGALHNAKASNRQAPAQQEWTPLPLGYTPDGKLIARVPPGVRYKLQVKNNHLDQNQRFVLKPYILNAKTREKIYFLFYDDHMPRDKNAREDTAFKPLWPNKRTTFEGFQVEYTKKDYTLKKSWHPFEARRDHGAIQSDDHDLDHSTDSTESTSTTSHCPEEIHVEVYRNAGDWTCNRGGGHCECRRKKPAGGSVTVPGKLDNSFVDCPGAAKRWESAQGKFIGTLTLSLAIRQ
ncbi:unnamed protein product [Amoebophrya sp. A25]|nr:unnamed protein product [Amoebophrya sp. A25]|eukprot:GSA25T00025988001.1